MNNQWVREMGALCDSCMDPYVNNFVSMASTGDGMHVTDSTHHAMIEALRNSRKCIHNSVGDGSGWLNPDTIHWTHGFKYAPSEEEANCFVWIIWSNQ